MLLLDFKRPEAPRISRGHECSSPFWACWSKSRWIGGEVCALFACVCICWICPKENGTTWLPAESLPVSPQRPGSAQTAYGGWPVHPRLQMPDSCAWMHTTRINTHTPTRSLTQDIHQWTRASLHQSLELYDEWFTHSSQTNTTTFCLYKPSPDTNLSTQGESKKTYITFTLLVSNWHTCGT